MLSVASSSSGVKVSTPFLLAVLFVYMTPVLSHTDCSPITLGEGSPLFPDRTKGGNVTMYRVFHTDGNPSELNITWRRQPASLSSSSGRYRINNTTFSDNTAKSSITVWNLMLRPDIGSYTVTACSNCTCSNTTFVLVLFPCDPDLQPQPVEQYVSTAIAEPSLSGSLPLYLWFCGDMSSFYYPTYWRHGGKDVCSEHREDQDSKFSCNRTSYGNCTFTANLYIAHPSHVDSGNYSVRAVGYNAVSNISTFQIDIVPEPSITCSNHNIGIHGSNKGKVECKVQNYSQFVNLSVVKDHVTLVNVYAADNVCIPYIEDSRVAICTVHLKRGRFKLCVGYNSSVEHQPQEPTSNCSDFVHVSPDVWTLRNEIMIGVGGVVLLVIVTVCICTCYCCWRRRKTSQNTEHELCVEPSDTDQLLQYENPSMRGGVVEHDAPLDRQHQPVLIDPPPSRAYLVTVVYPQNPVVYTQIAPPDFQTIQRDNPGLTVDDINARYRDQVADNEASIKRNISVQRELVKQFVHFLQRLPVGVVYDQQLDDQHVESKTLWMQERIRDSDYVILVITPSFLHFMHRAPKEEIFFQGPYLHNLILGLEKKSDGSKIKVVCVFLDRPKCLNHTPADLRTGSIFELWKPFQRGGEEREDDLENFVSLLLQDSDGQPR